jgi:NADH:ubiquinone oxidoreductase subunit 6 (subunit J)
MINLLPLATAVFAAVNWHSCAFALFAVLTCFFAIAVAATNNIVRMAFYLTLALGSTAGLFFLAGAEFVGAMQFMIYVGGTLVLLIFGVMLTAHGNFINMKTAAGEWVISGALGAALFVLLVRSSTNVDSWIKPRPDATAITVAEGQTTGALGLSLVGIRVDKFNEPNERLRAGYSGYLLPFVIVSMHLLVVLVGAAYMARTKRRGSGRLEAASHTNRAERSDMPFFPTVGIVKGIIINLALAVICFTSSRWLPAVAGINETAKGFVDALQNHSTSLLPSLGMLFLLNAGLLGVVWNWQAWGMVGLVVVPLVQAWLIANSALGFVPAVVFLVALWVPLAALYLLFQQGGVNSVWNRME